MANEINIPKKSGAHSKTARVFAWIGIGLLLALYLFNLILALIGSDFAKTMLMCNSVLTVLIPIILYFLVLMIKKRHPDKDGEDETAAK